MGARKAREERADSLPPFHDLQALVAVSYAAFIGRQLSPFTQSVDRTPLVDANRYSNPLTDSSLSAPSFGDLLRLVDFGYLSSSIQYSWDPSTARSRLHMLVDHHRGELSCWAS